MMCKWDEAFTMNEMLEETSRCKDCKLNCENAGKQLSEEDKVKLVCKSFIELVESVQQFVKG